MGLIDYLRLDKQIYKSKDQTPWVSHGLTFIALEWTITPC